MLLLVLLCVAGAGARLLWKAATSPTTSPTTSSSGSDASLVEADPSDEEPSSEEPNNPAPVSDEEVSEMALVEDPEPEEDLETMRDSGVSLVSSASFLYSAQLEAVETEIAVLEEQGWELGFVLLDLASGRSLSYNADGSFYCASSIKAAYCAMLLETYGSEAPLASIREVIEWSSNEHYATLTDRYTLNAFSAWLSDLGAAVTAENTKVTRYPHSSPAELSLVWQEIYRFCTSGEEGAEDFATYLENTNTSAIRGVLGASYTVWNKAGWYEGSGGYDATADAGVIFSDCGDYLMVIMTDIPSDMDALLPLVDALNAAHGELCGGAVESLVTEESTSDFS